MRALHTDSHSQVSLEPFLLQAEQPQLSQPVVIREAFHPLDHFGGLSLYGLHRPMSLSKVSLKSRWMMLVTLPLSTDVTPVTNYHYKQGDERIKSSPAGKDLGVLVYVSLLLVCSCQSALITH